MPNSTQPVSPFTSSQDSQLTDSRLATDALAGDRRALEALICRHQPWIYNLAFRMVMVREDAEDVTQEFLVKVITKLASYDSTKAAFRTWLYRMVANHVINMKTRGYEAAISDPETYYSFIDKVPDQDPDSSPETQLIIADLTVGCVMGILLCLERTQRLVFILAIGFNVTDIMGAEILDMSREAFRKTLSRARAKLHEFMNGNCGLVNPEASCRCRKKVTGFIQSGAYSPERIIYHQANAPQLQELVGSAMESLDEETYGQYVKLFRSHPFYPSPDAVAWLRQLIEGKRFQEAWLLEERRGIDA